MAYFLRFFVKSAVDSQQVGCQHPIHISAWKVNSANFTMTEFSEVRVYRILRSSANSALPVAEGYARGSYFKTLTIQSGCDCQ
jgi:hypothetical protein